MPALEFSINPRLGASVDLQQLGSALQHLVSLFKASTPKVIPSSIQQPPEAESILRLSAKLAQVAGIPGFERHVRAYLYGVEPTFFVTCLASYLLNASWAIELEPLTRKRKSADLLVDDSGEQVFFECKSPKYPLGPITEEQQQIFATLHPFLDTPHAVTLRFRAPLSMTQVQGLGAEIRRRLPSVREDGVFLTQGDIEVSVDLSTDPAPASFHMQLILIVPDPEDSMVLPGLIKVRFGKKLAIYGPATNWSEVLVRRMEKAKKQAPLNAPCIVAISSRTLLGAPRDHRLAVLEQFTPKNRRVSGVLIADFPVTVAGQEQPKLRFIANPYAKHPVSEKLRATLGGVAR